MQIDELKNEGLTREYKVTLDKDELDRRIDTILADVRDKVRMKGFRPGKAPMSLLRRLHGEAARSQAVEESVRESTDKLFQDKGVRPATQPQIELGEVTEDAGFDFTVSAEILPDIDVEGFRPPKLERMTAKVGEAEVEEALKRLADQSKSFEPAAKTAKAKDGDAVVIDFAGKIDGEEFEGGTGEDVEIELGAGRFIEGFEEQLVGVKAGDACEVRVTFPDAYARADLAGKEAVFDVAVKEVKRPKPVEIDDDLAKNFGMDDLAALREALREQVQNECTQLSRAQVKRQLLDKLHEAYDFPVPQRMVDMEYRNIWEQIKRDAIMNGEAKEEDVADLEEPESEEERKEFRDIAERRVRLGLLLSELGMANKIELGQDDVMRKAVEEARKYPGQEQQVFEYLTQNEQGQAQLRAPLYEEKVVDFVIEMAEVDEQEVDLEKLRKIVQEAEEEVEPSSDAGKKPAAKSTQKKAASKSSGGAKKTAAKSTGTTKKTAAKSGAAKKTASSGAKKAASSGAKKPASAAAKKTPASAAAKKTPASGAAKKDT